MSAISVNTLSKSYGDKEAVKGVSFDVKNGEIFGFLGPNGAGKTTIIKMLTTLIPPTSGSAKVVGLDIVSEAPEIRKRIGVVQQQESYEVNLTLEKALDLYGLLWGVPGSRRKILIEELLDRFGLKDSRRVNTSDLSIGLRRRLQVAREFIHGMDLLFLDEPTMGLDPVVRREALELFKERARDGLTIFFTTHILEEAEYLCDRVALINDGRIITIDTPDNVKRRFGRNKTVELKVKGILPEEFKDRLQQIDSVDRVLFRDEATVAIVTPSSEEVVSHVLRLTEKFGLEIFSIYVAQPSLEDVFISIIKEARV